MPKTVTVVVTYAIPWERFPEWASAIVDLVDTVKAEVPRLTSYTVYITEDSSEATSVWSIRTPSRLSSISRRAPP